MINQGARKGRAEKTMVNQGARKKQDNGKPRCS